MNNALQSIQLTLGVGPVCDGRGAHSGVANLASLVRETGLVIIGTHRHLHGWFCTRQISTRLLIVVV